MSIDPRLSILTFPQEFDGTRLRLRILIVPRLSGAWDGNPLDPLILNFPNVGDTTPAFADADLQFEAHVLDGLDRFPASTPVDFTAALPQAGGVAADARKLYQELVAPVAGRFKLSTGTPVPAPEIKKEIYIRKYLPRTYRASFLFTGPRTPDAATDDSYQCAVKGAGAPNPNFQPSPDDVNWGQIYAYCLRHPKIAQKLGLIREASFEVKAPLFEHGGYLYVDLANKSDYAAQAAADFDFLKRYAARIPQLATGKGRQLFAAVEFPVLYHDPNDPNPPTAPGNFDEVFIEAADYDDGFAKIVHAVQPVSQNLLAEDPDGFAPLTDIGIRLGWDDEQILIWQNRQLKEDTTVPQVNNKPQRLDAPMGVFGYRIDASQHGKNDWISLVEVRSKTQLRLGGIDLESDKHPFELAVEVHPMQLDGNQATGQFWLPSYLAQWNGKSLVLPDEDAAAIFKTEKADKRAQLGKLYDPVGLGAIPLRYGTTYDLRVRLTDPTGGGVPHDTKSKKHGPLYDSPAPVATVAFRRHVVFEPLRIDRLPRIPDQPADAYFAGDVLSVRRPLLGYPSVVFTGKYADPITPLIAASDAAVGKDSFGIPDPDARRIRIDVEVGTLRMDNLLSLSGREAYIHLYTTHRDFPADFAVQRDIPLKFRDAHVLHFQDPNDLGDLGLTQAEIDKLDEIVLPTGREIRLTVRAVADDDPAYFAPMANIGKPLQVRLRREAADERDLIAKFSAAKMIRGIYLQPDPVPAFDGAFVQLLFQRTTGATPAIIQRLAQQIDVDHKGLTLVGKQGERVVFGCSRRIRHTLAPDNSSLTFAAKEDLNNHWIVALTLELNRDWTWDGLDEVSFEIFRTLQFKADAEVDDNGGKPIGDWEVKRTAPIQALANPQRDRTTLIFLDAVEPKSALLQPGSSETRFPDLIELDYRVEPRFRTVPKQPDDSRIDLPHLELPVTTPPAQVPRIVSAGIALSKYERDPASYSFTRPRRRFLWLELEQPAADPNDAFFVRLLGYAPDPLLSDDRWETLVPPEEAPLPIDPELIRVVAPDPPHDEAGLSAMVMMEAGGNEGRHFLVPLPPGLNADSPELFGFFTYELRVGHAKIWSTAQGRFGRALRTTGVQHPAPTLFCTCQRYRSELVVGAPYAEAVLAGKNITARPPRTQIWALLYAQVKQADGKDFRNILLDDRELRLIPPLQQKLSFQNVDALARGKTSWTQAEILELLRDLGLASDAPLSVLCVEMLPGFQAYLSPFAAARPMEGADLVAGVRAARSGTSETGAAAVGDDVRPLSDALGHFRILRTSPLTPVPPVC